MKVYVVTEHEPSEASVVGVYEHKADAMSVVQRRFDASVDDHPDTPEEFAWTDHDGGCIGDCSNESGWVYWNIEPHEVY